MEQIHTSTFNTLKGMCFTNYHNDVYKATTQDKFILERLGRQKSFHKCVGNEVMMNAIENQWEGD